MCVGEVGHAALLQLPHFDVCLFVSVSLPWLTIKYLNELQRADEVAQFPAVDRFDCLLGMRFVRSDLRICEHGQVEGANTAFSGKHVCMASLMDSCGSNMWSLVVAGKRGMFAWPIGPSRH